MIDLHIHTSHSSDGMYTPVQLLDMARQKELKALAFADHNEVAANHDGVKHAPSYGITYVPAAEFNSFYGGQDIHVLGYFIDYTSEVMMEFLAHIRAKKDEQSRQRYEKLRELGYEMTYEDVVEMAGGRPATGVSFLKAIMKYPKNLSDARLEPYLTGAKSRSPFFHFYGDYFKPGGHAFVEMKDVPTDEVIHVILQCRGIPVIAHPKDMTKSDIERMKTFGAQGLEVYTSYHDEERRVFYRGIAEELGMVMTAGSDFHGEKIKKDVKLGEIGGNEMVLLDRLNMRYKDMYGKDPRSL